MLKDKNPYRNFKNYILRVPLFPFSSYKEITSGKKIDTKDFKIICSNPIFKEALFLASPSLYSEMIRWLSGGVNDKKKEERLKLSLFKYFSRMSSRCTPFGLFAGCSVGIFHKKTSIELKKANNNRHTRLDMNYLVELSQNLAQNAKIKEQLLFYPNTSIYRVDDKYRYVEYKYLKSRRFHQVVSVEASEYLEIVIARAMKGSSLFDLIQVLINDEISIEEASEFIEELVSSQFLISELEPSVSGPEFLNQICDVLQKLKGVENILDILNRVNQTISRIDQRIGNDPQEYLKLGDFLKKLGADFEPKFLFQTDMVLNNKKNTININTIDDLKRGLDLLNKISLLPQTTFLDQFKDAFYERYEDREILLSKALDVELGVGYKQNEGTGDVNPFIDDITIQNMRSKKSLSEIKWTSLNSFFQNKFITAYKERAYTITISDKDFKGYEIEWEDFPDTFSCMIELIEDDDMQKIKYIGSAGSSAANLLGRFSHGNQEVYSYVKEITDMEAQLNKDRLIAEIVHLPESRVGNVLMHPDFHAFEIPYLAKSLKPIENQIPLDDLLISIKNNRILLRSKKYDKEVIPRLTNAHNYSKDALPIYHFLSDMQTQGLRKGLGLDLGPLSRDYKFIPRIVYNEIILHSATWNLTKEDLEPLLNCKNDDDILLGAIKVFTEHFQIPQFAMLSDGDNELLVNFKNLTSIRMLLKTVDKRANFKLTEFLFSDNGVVREGNSYYTNQVIVSFYRENNEITKRKIL